MAPQSTKHVSEPDIFLFIQELGGDEKSYYKKLAKRHANLNLALHLKLFALIEQGKIKGQPNLAKALNLENKAHFSSLKSYLCKDILDALVFKQRNSTVEMRLYFMLHHVRILHESMFFALAEKILKKAIALARLYEKYYLLMMLLNLKSRNTELTDCERHKKKKETLFSEVEKTFTVLNACERNKILFEKVRFITHKCWLPITDYESREIHEAENQLKKIKDNRITPLISLLHLNTLAMCQYMLHKNKACTRTCKTILGLWIKSPHLINEYSVLFLNSINTNFYNDFSNHDIDSVTETLKEYKKLKARFLSNGNALQHFEVIQFNTELKIYIKTAHFKKVKGLIEKNAEKILLQYCRVLAPADRLSIKSTICISRFILEDWDEAEVLLLEIKEQNKQINREDVLYFSLLFHLVILFEKKEWYRLHFAIKAAYLTLYTKKKLRPFEHDLMLFFARFTNKNFSRNTSQIISNFLKKFDKYRNDPDKAVYLRYFNYYGWLESKLLNIRYTEYIKEATHTV